MFAVNKHEKATSFILSLELNFVQWKLFNRFSMKQPSHVVAA